MTSQKRPRHRMSQKRPRHIWRHRKDTTYDITEKTTTYDVTEKTTTYDITEKTRHMTSQKRPRHMTSQKRPRHMTLEINMFSEIQENIANTKMYTVQPPHQTSLIPPYFCVCSKHRFKIYMASVVISVIRILRLNLIKIKCLLHFFTFFFSDSLLSNGIHLGVIK